MAEVSRTRQIALSAGLFIRALDIDGVENDGTGDSLAGINEALATEQDVYLDFGTYNTTGAISMSTSGQKLWGAGGHGNLGGNAITEIQCSATTGAMIRYNQRSTSIRGLRLTSTAARRDATTTSGFGIHGQAPDSALQSISRCMIEDVFIKDQPTDGVMCVGGHELSRFTLITVEDCTRHGYVFDDGTTVGRTNKDIAPFEMTCNHIRAFECGGNGILVGASGDTDITRLMTFNFAQSLGCAWDSSQRVSHHQIIDRGIQTTWNGVDVEDQQYANSTTSGGKTRTALANPSAGINNFRDYSQFNYPYFSSLTESLNLNTGGNGIKVIDPNIALGTYGVAQADAIVIPNTVNDFYGEFVSSRITGATDIVRNQSTTSRYKIDGVMYQGINSTLLDWKLNDVPEDATVSGGTLEITARKINVIGQNDEADTVNRLRLFSGLNGIEGLEVELHFGGSTSYTITYNDVSGGGTNIRTRDASALAMTDTTRSVVRLTCNANLEWVEV